MGGLVNMYVGFVLKYNNIIKVVKFMFMKVN